MQASRIAQESNIGFDAHRMNGTSAQELATSPPQAKEQRGAPPGMPTVLLESSF